MQGSPAVLSYLNFLLAGELAARDQYFIHSRMFHEWGYGKLHDRINHEMADETGHASALIARILMLGGTPAMTPEKLHIGTDVVSMLENDLAVEFKVRADLKKGVAPSIRTMCHAIFWWINSKTPKKTTPIGSSSNCSSSNSSVCPITCKAKPADLTSQEPSP